MANVGRVVSAAYEQLRNAAEYTQEHLLRQRAIRRYFARNVPFHAEEPVDKAIAEELIVELTQAGYLENDTQPHSVLDKIYQSVAKHQKNYWRMVAHTDKKTAEEWTLDLISVEAETIIGRDQKLKVYQQFAFQHYKETIDKGQFASGDDSQYDASLYVAVHRALLRSDMANVRYDLQQLYQYPDAHIGEYVHFHKNITHLYSSQLTDALTRFIDRHGAPLRVLKAMIESNPNLPDLLQDNKRFLSAFEAQVTTEYRQAGKRLNQGLLKSIVFLLITKTLVGLMVEIPYDLAVAGAIAALPLAINLVAPVVYLLILKLGLKLPGEANTKAIATYIDTALYGNSNRAYLYGKPPKRTRSFGFTAAYALTFVVAFGVVVNRLILWEFNLVQGVLFFIFLATASFLGFRLTHIIRELELVTAKPGIIQLIRDFFYMPFIVLGRWISEKYQKINIVALILDTAIELPLKTVLRLVRQWANFINDKKDSL